MFVGHLGWGQNRFDGLPQRPVSMPIGANAPHDSSSTASRMSAESSSESEAHSVSSLGKGSSGTNGNKEGGAGSKDKKSGMFRFLSKKKRTSQPPN